jgi:small subunit ribosomal protein S2
LKELVDAGFHFGHRVSRWNPKMKPYIYGKRNLIHIIDLRETIRGILIAKKFLAKLCAQGKEVLFVGAKQQAKAAVEREALRCGMHFVNERWLGGTLTNFSTIRKRLERWNQLERMEADGTFQQESKKVQSTLIREKRKLETDMRGIRNMTQLPGALIIIDPKREKIAVAEARKLEIPTIALADTDCDPDKVDILIPGNDDAIRAIEIVCTRLTDSALEGRALAPRVPPKPEFHEVSARPMGRGDRPRRPRPAQAPAREGGGGMMRAGVRPVTEGGGRGGGGRGGGGRGGGGRGGGGYGGGGYGGPRRDDNRGGAPAGAAAPAAPAAPAPAPEAKPAEPPAPKPAAPAPAPAPEKPKE